MHRAEQFLDVLETYLIIFWPYSQFYKETTIKKQKQKKKKKKKNVSEYLKFDNKDRFSQFL